MDRLFIVLCVIMFALVALVVVYLPMQLYTESKCLENGYPDYSVAVNFEKYCVITVEQTQYVCRLDDVLSGKCDKTIP